MKKVFALMLALALLVSFAGCDTEQPSVTTPSDKISLNVYNWGQYIADGSDDSLDIIAEFEARYPHIDVNYSTFDSNEIMYSKLSNGGITVDVIFPSDYMVARLIEEDMLLPLDFGNIPNYQYIDEAFRNMAYDPENKYSVPYTWGTVGIIYNSKYVDEADVTGWELLWNEKYDDKILMFDNSRDAFGIAALLQGYDLNTTDEAELRDCAAALAEQKPLVQQYVMDQIYDLMENEEAWIAPYYAGDYTVMAEENEALEFFLPAEQGFNLFTDAMCIPTCCQQKEAAELFINFLCDPEISAANMEWVEYSVPSTAAKAYLDEETTSDPVAYPSDEALENGTSYAYLLPEVTRFVESLFMEVRIS
ncbi:MAG: spermidine/putrescine ABC transporter substrate-binding protein [Oscillospiraceae bacterium]|nr:spermidine/putrescine ABC transporter substrate-binding protein [Oscillospiraceae bacterium]